MVGRGAGSQLPEWPGRGPRVGLRRSGGAPRADGPLCVPSHPSGRPRGRGCVPGGVSLAGEEGAIGQRGRLARPLAARSHAAGGSAVRAVASREVPAWAVSGNRTLDPAVSAVQMETRHLVGLEITRLPRKYREAVALCHLDGLSHDGAAEALGLPVGTIRSRLSRARDLLRARLLRRGLAPGAVAAWFGGARLPRRCRECSPNRP